MTDRPTASVVLRRLTAPLPWLFLAACLGLSFHYARIGWGFPLLDLWQFRETQTALAARDFVENGFRFAYETPVLGAPWSIPFEFPTYQIFVALLVKVSGLPLDPAGRWVSLAFAYGAFALLAVLVTRGTGSRAAGLFSAALCLVAPIYIYGARAFMIESTALALTLGLLVAVQEFLFRPSVRTLAWTFLVGAFAGPTKGTTYAVGLVGVACLVIFHARPAWTAIRTDPRRRLLGFGFLAALLLPFLFTVLWTHYTDVVKSRNEFAAFTTSSALRDWNFGTWAQRLDLNTWTVITQTIGDDVLGQPVTWILGTLIAACGRARPLSWIFGLMFLTGLLVFTNLFFVHNYYYFATAVYLLALFGIGLGGLWDQSGGLGRLVVGLVVAPALAGLLLLGYVHRTLPRQTTAIGPALPLAEAIKRFTPPSSAILVYGSDWDSSLPYYAHRHALMERTGMPPDYPPIQRALARLDRPLAAVVFRGAARASLTYVQHQLNGLHATGPLVFSDESGDVYLLKPAPYPSVLPWENSGFDNLGATYESAFETRRTVFHLRNGMMIHAPGLMKVPRPAHTQLLRFSFGIEDAAYAGPQKTDGVTFVVDFVPITGSPQHLFTRRLEPATVPADRGDQTKEISLPSDQAGTLFFRSETGPGSSFDWSVWHDVQLQ